MTFVPAPACIAKNVSAEIRKSFTKIREVMSIPNLIEVQKNSYHDFLMKDIPADQRGDQGFNSVFKSVFPIHDYLGNATIEFIKYDFDEPKFDLNECRVRSLTYCAPLRITLRLIVFETDETLPLNILLLPTNSATKRFAGLR